MKLKEVLPLFEAPLPPEIEARTLDSRPGKYSSVAIIKKFEEFGERVGKGSSRIVFKVDIDASLLDHHVLSEYNLPTSGHVETVFKLALNGKGISQNRSEIEHFDNYSHWDSGRFLLPILDTSARNKNIHLDDVSLSNWVQMPLAQPIKKVEFRTMFIEEFGNIFKEFTSAEFNHRMRFNTVVDYLHDATSKVYKAGKQNDEQNENFYALTELMQNTGLHIGDLSTARNWCKFNNKLFIWDYGFDKSTLGLYSRGDDKVYAHAYVDGDGNIRLTHSKYR